MGANESDGSAVAVTANARGAGDAASTREHDFDHDNPKSVKFDPSWPEDLAEMRPVCRACGVADISAGPVCPGPAEEPKTKGRK